MKNLLLTLVLMLVTFTANAQDVNTNDSSMALAAVQLDGKWGFIDQQGNEVIPIQYEDVDSFYAVW